MIQEPEKEMIFEFKKCGGCGTCEIACSFRRHGFFDRHSSLIRVVDEGDDFKVSFIEQQDKQCDGCVELEEPMCATYCHDPDRLIEIIDQYRSMLKTAAGVEGDE